ncbi:MAG: TrkA family potassium uptake protein [Fuerstiella sp.]|jgi:trk system potassium uptake protein TrkA
MPAQTRRIAVIGLGRFGTALARQLSRHGAEVLAIDANEQLVEDIANDVAISICLDSTDEAALRSQEVDRVDTVVVAIGENFEAALLTTVICKKNLKVPHVVCRAQTMFHAQIFSQIGADEVIEPEQDAGLMLGRRLAHPRINDYIKLADGFTVLELVAPDRFAGRTVRDINLRSDYEVNLIGIRRQPEDAEAAQTATAGSHSTAKPRLISVPGPDDVIKQNDVLLLAGSDEALARLSQL